MVIRSLFVPDTCLQNDKFSAHVTWDKNQPYSVLLKIPPEIKIDKLFNVEKHRDSDNTIHIEKTEINGYVGFTFYSDLLENPLHLSKLEFEIYKNDEKLESIVKNILFFRPEIVINSIPKSINIQYNGDYQSFEVSDTIHILNNGQGTAQINVKVKDDDNCSIIPLSSVDEFRIKFVETLNKELNTLSNNFSQYEEDIDNLLDLFNNPPSFDKKTIKNIKNIVTRIEEILENDEEFGDEFIRALFHSYYKNINPFANIQEFKKYIDSIEKNKIVMINSIDFFEFEEGKTELNVILERTDLAFNEYSNISIPSIEVVTNQKCKIPIHALFNWGEI